VTEAEIRQEVDRLYRLHDVLVQRLSAGVEIARPALKVVAAMIAERERALADWDDRLDRLRAG
jgi:hypothetical protein